MFRFLSMKYKVIITSFFLSSFLFGQNLVLNPDFENHEDDHCTVMLGFFNKNITDWSTPNYGSTDYFMTCNETKGRKNYNGFQNPKSGSAYAGIYVFTDKNYREYVQGQLSEILEKGKRYTMTFYLSLAEKSSYALKDIEVLFTEEKLKPCYHSNSCEKAIKPSKATKKRFKKYPNPTGNYFMDKKTWMAYTFEFTAEGYEAYFSIGNFFRNPKTKKQNVLSNSAFFFSYYYIDAVSVVPLEKTLPVAVEEKEKVPALEENKTYTFKSVLFDFDKATLLEASKQELEMLSSYLMENPHLDIEIYGHTDNIGLKARNEELSKQRAKAVADYLILKHVASGRVKSFGYGSSKPLATNDTEEGRQENRRVEFKLIEK